MKSSGLQQWFMMKHAAVWTMARARLFPVVLLLVMAACRAAAQFEGVVESKNVTTDEMGEKQQFTITMWIKNDRIRVQMSSTGTMPSALMIYRLDRKVTWMINEDEHSYFEILRDPQSSGSQQSVPGNKGMIKRTGKTRKILGYLCEQVLVTLGDQVTEIWGTKQLAPLLKTTSRVLGDTEKDMGEGGWSAELESLGLYPLEASTRIEGKVVESQTTTRIEQGSVRPELFELPPGYKKQEIGQEGKSN